jgi:hypothetical protein
MTFAANFVFERARPAAYLDRYGAVQVAGQDEPRIDHTLLGQPLGLKVEGFPEYDQADRVSVVAGDWANTPATVLHAYDDPDGVRHHRAYYTSHADQTINGCLAIQGWHRRVTVLPETLPDNGNGFVLWRGLLWTLPSMIELDGPEVLLDDGDGNILRDG